ncbi:MAG: hypothetical protein IEMM0008_0721 [bacterium]|nr:MAG: hypothetical protein IEMM0008_0721 [bacterium]
MKKYLVILVTVFVLFISGKAAHAFEIDAAFHIATESTSGSGMGIGAGVGVAFDIADVKFAKIMGRVDVSYIDASDSTTFFGTTTKTTFTRIPIFTGARLVFPVSKLLKPYAEAGFELSFDKSEVTVGTITASSTGANFGAAFGGGINFDFGGFFAGVNLRYHAISAGYLTFSPTIGFSF